jgi:hypothetical protein
MTLDSVILREDTIAGVQVCSWGNLAGFGDHENGTVSVVVFLVFGREAEC